MINPTSQIHIYFFVLDTDAHTPHRKYRDLILHKITIYKRNENEKKIKPEI